MSKYTDTSKCFRGSLRFRDNESRLHIDTIILVVSYRIPYMLDAIIFPRAVADIGLLGADIGRADTGWDMKIPS